MNEEELRNIFVNPFYAITISPILAQNHEPMVTKDEWVKANAKLIGEMGAEEWLRRLLEVLETGTGKETD